MKGLKWHPDMGYYPNSEESYEVLKVLNEYELPLLTHCSPLGGTRAKYAEPIHLDDITLDFPNISVIAAHSGMMWWHDWVALAQFQPRLSGDLAMWQCIAESKPKIFRKHLREILDIIARRASIPASKVIGAASFYSQFRFEPAGRYTIKVCQGTACHISGASKLLDVLVEELGIAEGETTKDKLFTLETVACLGCCSLAPVIMINETTYGRLTTNKVKKIVNDYRNGRAG